MTRRSEIDRFVRFLAAEFVDFVDKPAEEPLIPDFCKIDTASTDDNINEFEEYELEKIYLYPIKSCGAQRVHSWPIGSDGLLFDRMWVIVDEYEVAITQKKCPLMVRVLPEINLANGTITFSSNIIADHEPLTVSLNSIQPMEHDDVNHGVDDNLQDEENVSVKDSRIVRVCGRRRPAKFPLHEEAKRVNAWLSLVLNCPCRLMAAVTVKDKHDILPPLSSSSSLTSFKNDQPFLVVNQDSVNEVSEMVGRVVHSLVFRPNFVIRRKNVSSDSLKTHGKKHIANFVASQRRLSLLVSNNTERRQLHMVSRGPCQRCSMVNIDPSSGDIVGGENGVLKALTSSNPGFNCSENTKFNFADSSNENYSRKEYSGKTYFGEFFSLQNESFVSSEGKCVQMISEKLQERVVWNDFKVEESTIIRINYGTSHM